MTKYRIALQEVKGSKYKHRHNIMLRSDDLDDVIAKITQCLNHEIDAQRLEFYGLLIGRENNKKLKEITDTDKFDRHAVGKTTKFKDYVAGEQFDY